MKSLDEEDLEAIRRLFLALHEEQVKDDIRVSRIKGFLSVVKTTLTVLTALWVPLTALWFLAASEVREWSQEFLGINTLATSEDVFGLQAQIHQLTGADGVIQWHSAETYVLEPVNQGDESLVFSAKIRRTTQGAPCRITGAFPVFKDSSGATYRGEFLGRMRQFGTEWTEVKPEVSLPSELKTGVVTLILSLEYSCPPGVTEVDQIGPLRFLLNEGRRK